MQLMKAFEFILHVYMLTQRCLQTLVYRLSEMIREEELVKVCFVTR